MAWRTHNTTAHGVLRISCMFAASMTILSQPALAIPRDIRNGMPAGVSPGAQGLLPHPDEAPDLSMENTFIRKTLEEETSRIWFGSRRSYPSQTNNLSAFSPDEAADEQPLISHFVRLYNLDMEMMDGGQGTGNTPATSGRLYLPMEDDLFLQDLRIHPPKTNEMAAVMRQVAKTLADQSSDSSQTGVPGWGSAIMCLLMAAMVFLVAVAKK